MARTQETDYQYQAAFEPGPDNTVVIILSQSTRHYLGAHARGGRQTKGGAWQGIDHAQGDVTC